MALGTDTVDEGHLPAEKIAELEPDDKRAKANRPRAQKEWTSVNLSDRAKLVDKNLYGFYGPSRPSFPSAGPDRTHRRGKARRSHSCTLRSGFPQLIDKDGRGERIRTSGLLVPRLAAFAISLITQQIFLK
jgi:hypothetical protein